jgi:hypothetical protein
MNKRLLAIVLVLFAIATVILAFVWVVLPLFRPSTEQPPPLPSPAGPVTPPTPAFPTQPPEPPPDPNSPAEKERQAQEALKRRAVDFASRVASYSSVDDFAGIRDVFGDATAEVQSFLEAERKKLVEAHPSFGPSWGQTTRSVASRIEEGIPVLNGTRAVVVVQTQKTIERSDGPSETRYEEAVLSFQKVNGEWLVNRIEWRAYQP